MFVLVGCSLVVAFQYFLCFVHGEGQQASKKDNKNVLQRDRQVSLPVSFYQLGLTLAGGFAHSFQGAVARTFVHNL